MTELRQSGFTLVEATIVIVITGIIVAIVAVFIRLPIEGYADSAARAELADEADTALRRIARDLRLALPNSIRTAVDADGNAYIEFLLTRTGGRYLAEEDNPTAGSILDFAAGSTSKVFSVVGPMPSGVQQVVPGDRVVVYNLGSGYTPADAYTGGNMATVTAVGASTITLDANPFAAQSPKMRSPTKRFQVVSGPVTYTCRGSNLVRYWNYAIQPGQPSTVAALTAAGGTSALLSTHLTTGSGAGCVFSFNVMGNRNSSLVGLQISLQSPTKNGGALTMFHQVHVDNTP